MRTCWKNVFNYFKSIPILIVLIQVLLFRLATLMNKSDFQAKKKNIHILNDFLQSGILSERYCFTKDSGCETWDNLIRRIIIVSLIRSGKVMLRRIDLFLSLNHPQGSCYKRFRRIILYLLLINVSWGLCTRKYLFVGVVFRDCVLLSPPSWSLCAHADAR